MTLADEHTNVILGDHNDWDVAAKMLMMMHMLMMVQMLLTAMSY